MNGWYSPAELSSWIVLVSEKDAGRPTMKSAAAFPVYVPLNEKVHRGVGERLARVRALHVQRDVHDRLQRRLHERRRLPAAEHLRSEDQPLLLTRTPI